MSIEITYSKSLILNTLLAHATNSDKLLDDLSEHFKDKDDDYLLEVIYSFSRNTMLNNFEIRILTEAKTKLMNRIEEHIN